MASRAYRDHLVVLLQDAEELESAHKKLRTGKRGRQYGLGALNRGVVVLCVSAWEAYVEELVKEALAAIRPPAPPLGNWPSLNAAARSQVGRLNNPTPENVRSLFADALGVADVTSYWHWKRVDQHHACERLGEALRSRHEIAHGVNPRPTIHNHYAKSLPGFFRRLAQHTDRGMREYLVQTLGVASPWPA